MSQNNIDYLKQRILPACPTEVTEYVEYLENAVREQQVLGKRLLGKLDKIEKKIEKLMETQNETIYK